MSRKQRMHNELTLHLQPETLIIENESSRHSVPEGAETHFKVVVVSECFANKARIERHCLMHNLLASELKQGLHALTLHLYTPSEWQEQTAGVPVSPVCRGGMKKDSAH